MISQPRLLHRLLTKEQYLTLISGLTGMCHTNTHPCMCTHLLWTGPASQSQEAKFKPWVSPPHSCALEILFSNCEAKLELLKLLLSDIPSQQKEKQWIEGKEETALQTWQLLSEHGEKAAFASTRSSSRMGRRWRRRACGCGLWKGTPQTHARALAHSVHPPLWPPWLFWAGSS